MKYTILLLLMLAVPVCAQVRKAVEPVPGQYIVALKEGETVRFGNVKKVFSRGYVSRMSPALADKVSRDPRVEAVEEDGIVRIQQSQQTSPPWNIDRVDQRGWPLDLVYSYGYDGAGVTAYVLDTGIYYGHQEFGGRAYFGADFVDPAGDGGDCNGHGTHVAGIIGGYTSGVAKGVSLVSVRVMGCDGTGQFSALLEGIDWVTANRQGPAVINMSVTSYGTSSVVSAAINRAVLSGITVVVASGNNGGDACDYFPAGHPAVITVAATGDGGGYDQVWTGSNSGVCVDLYAPGMGIVSAGTAAPDAYRSMSGTSMASPHVAGLAALYLQEHPSYDVADVRKALSERATGGVIRGVQRSTPDRFLYTLFDLLPDRAVCDGTLETTTSDGTGTYYYPSASGFTVGSGTLTASIRDFGKRNAPGLVLEKRKGSRWQALFKGSPVNYAATAGDYRFTVNVSVADIYQICYANNLYAQNTTGKGKP